MTTKQLLFAEPNRKLASVIVLGFLLAACASAPPRGRQGLLSFLEEGTTSKPEILEKLGQPSAKFGEKILTYRLDSDKAGYFLTSSPSPASDESWPPCWGQSLVLVFDDEGKLLRHSVVELMK